MLPYGPGTYVLILEAPRKGAIEVGRLGTLAFDGGWLVYVGSARGPGGLAARVGRHLEGGRKLQWHIDYLLQVCGVAELWYAEGEEEREEAWAEALRTSAGAELPLAGFGSSDCGCPGHLVRFQERPSVDGFRTKSEVHGGRVKRRVVLGGGPG